MQATAKLRRTLLATGSLAALVIAWSGAAQAQTSWRGTTSTDWFVGDELVDQHSADQR